jgi:hypothetical protein
MSSRAVTGVRIVLGSMRGNAPSSLGHKRCFHSNISQSRFLRQPDSDPGRLQHGYVGERPLYFSPVFVSIVQTRTCL